jgi:hypothetical protein
VYSSLTYGQVLLVRVLTGVILWVFGGGVVNEKYSGRDEEDAKYFDIEKALIDLKDIDDNKALYD